MNARTIEGNELLISEQAVQGLRTRLRGPLLSPGDPGYEDSRTVWNAMIDRKPALVARCLGVADVQACIAFARDEGVLLSIKGGGHNIAGLATCDGGLMLDLSLMRGVWVDPSRRLARAQAGCLLGDVDRETQVHGLATVLGFVSNTGIAGLTLGGGFGYLTRRYGYTSDNVLGMEMVTADGRVVRASEDENADLFWGLRGGGGNFGVVTGFDYGLYAVGPELLAGGMAWPAERAREVITTFKDLVEHAPNDLTLVLGLRPAPPAPWIDKAHHGKLIVAVFVCHSGTVEAGERLIAPLRSLGSPVGDIVQRRTYLSQQSLLDATQPKGRRYYWKSEYLHGVDLRMVDKLIDHAQRIPSPHSAILVFALGGALGDRPEDHSAAGYRNSKLVINIAAAWEKPADDQANIDWARTTWRDVREFSTGGTYVNFLTEEEDGDRLRAAYGSNFDRLVEIKSKWDPNNLFRTNKNIAPRGGA